MAIRQEPETILLAEELNVFSGTWVCAPSGPNAHNASATEEMALWSAGAPAPLGAACHTALRCEGVRSAHPWGRANNASEKGVVVCTEVVRDAVVAWGGASSKGALEGERDLFLTPTHRGRGRGLDAGLPTCVSPQGAKIKANGRRRGAERGKRKEEGKKKYQNEVTGAHRKEMSHKVW